MSNPAQEIAALRETIRHHDRKYYVEATPEITDLQYDRLMQQLTKLESEHPELITADSPTQRVGEQPVSHLNQVAHREPMLSIDNTYNETELRKFIARTEGLLSGEPIEWVVELKIDGVAASLIYEEGLLVRALTRGNGKVGDDVTHNVRTIADVPLKLTTDRPPSLLEVRGEIYMTNSALVSLNERQAAKGEAAYANTRNVAAGSIRLLDSRICAERNLRIFCHGTGYCEGLAATNHIEFLDEIASYGLPPTPLVQAFSKFDDAFAYAESIIERLHEFDFEVDGLVIKVNNFQQRRELGARSKSPRWVVAYKWELYEATTTLNEIRVQIGKTGAITPVAELEPVELAGTTVSRASLHNAEEIQRKDIRVGDVVIVEKAGKIIPHIVRVETHLRKGNPPVYEFPTVCPECTQPLVKDPGGVYIRCVNDQCPAQMKERLRYFATRNAMDIEGLGEKIVEQIVSAGLVKTYGDLYRLQVADLLRLERMGKRSAEKLVDAIAASKERGLARLLNALSIRHVGVTVANVLANHFGSIDAIIAASAEQLGAVDEIGGIIAESVYEFFHSETGAQIVADLHECGVLMHQQQSAPASDTFAGKTIVVTGTLSKYTRDEIHDLVKQHGGKAGSSISKKTDYLVAGEKAGSKLEKATSLGVKVISETEFESLIQSSDK
jgi:DNA ligase (NAD+)